MPTYTERAPGNYRARFVKLDTGFELTDKETGEIQNKWRWVWQELSDPTTVGEMDTITSPHFRSRSNGLKLFTGMLGRPPQEGDDTDSLIGQVFDVQYGPNANGRFTVVGALKVSDKDALKAATAHAEAVHNDQERDSANDTDALPF